MLPAVLTAKRRGLARGGGPRRQPARGGLVDGIEVLGARSLGQLHAWLSGKDPSWTRGSRRSTAEPRDDTDLADIVGQVHARYAVEVAAAGAHHLTMTGPPGVGKTMLAQRLPGLLPELSPSESLEVTAIHSVAGLLSGATPLITRPPFVAPHHTSSVAALVGGGTGMARPGAVSRAHRGVLFLDEYAEVGNSVLEALRTPLEDGEIRLARRDGVAQYPARFQLVLAANPCPCASPDPLDCICTSAASAGISDQAVGPAARPCRPACRVCTARRRRRSRPKRRSRPRWYRIGCTRPHAMRRLIDGENVRHPDERRSQRRAAAPSLPARTEDDGPLKKALDRGVLSIRGVRSDTASRVDAGRPGRPHVAGQVDDVTTALSFRQAGGGAMTAEVRLALAYLSRVAEPPCPELTALVAARRAGRSRRQGEGR